MTDPRRRPVIFLAFANDRSDQANYLRNLPEELRRVRTVLEPLDAHGICEIVVRTNTTVGELLDVFQDTRYRDRIAIFHFGGHAGDFQLLLESAAGAPVATHADGLAAFLGRQRGLQLVFLNGCSTQPQVEGLQRAGIPAVIATAEVIEDAVATELSARFYAGLASGAGLEAAYTEAVAAVRTRDDAPGPSTPLHGIVRDGAERAGRWPWELSIAEGAEAVRTWSLPEAAGDPLFGLPPLPERDLPDTPYRRLEWFREEDAELFFGRAREIRDLYERVTAPSTAPILLFHGQSGVGKSSLLAAGLLPRLRPTHEVRYGRRERESGLGGTLAAVLDTDTGTVVPAWHALETATGRPLVVILDQVEEVFTRPGAPDEWTTFLASLTELFASPIERPRGKLVLAFRKEWLADLESLLRDARLPRSRFFLERLDRDGVLEIINGPASTERLRRQYGLSVEDRLPVLIADDLLEDREAPVAPTLEILLAKMWDRTTAQGEDTPRFTIDVYQALKRDGLLLDDFLGEQLQSLRTWNAEVVDSGLALDLLARHTTPLGTAERRTRGDLEAAYAHRADVLPDLLSKAQETHLLVGQRRVAADGVESAETRLAHDTLAPLIRLRLENSDRPGQRAERILGSRVAEWLATGIEAPLDRRDLETVEAGRPGMRAWTDAERRLIAASREERARQDHVRRRLKAAAVVAVALIVVLGAAGWVLWRDARASAESALRRAYVSTAQTLTAAAPGQLGQDEHRSDRLWLLLARQAYLFNDRYDGPMFGTVDGAVRNALLSGRVALDFPGHEGDVRGVAFDPAGTRLASAGTDGSVRVWRLDEPDAESVVLTAHDGGVLSLAISPDGRLLASGGRDHTVKVWRLDDLAATPVNLAAHDQEVTTVAFSPDGEHLASGSRDRTVKLWRLADLGAAPAVLSVPDVRSIAFSPDGTRLASGGADGTVRVWPLVGPAADTVILAGHDAGVHSVAFAPDGNRIASASYDGTARVWRLDDPDAEPLVLAAHESFVHTVAFSPDGGHLASGGSDGTVRLWRLDAPGTPPLVLTGLDRTVYAVAFSLDGRRLAGAGGSRIPDLGVRVWQLNPPAAEPVVLTDHQTIVREFALGPPAADSTVHSVAFDAGGTALASGGSDGTVRLWHIADPVTRGSVLSGPAGDVYEVAFSPDGRRLAAAWGESDVLLWDLDDPGAGPRVITGPGEAVVATAFSPDGEWLAVGESGAESDVAIRLVRLDAPAAEPVLLAGHIAAVLSVAFSPDGTRLASTGGDGTIRLWRLHEAAGDSASLVLATNEYVTHALAFSPDGARLAAGMDYGRVRIFDLSDPSAEPAVLAGDDRQVNAVSFSPDGSSLASAGLDGRIRVWQPGTPASGDPLILAGHRGAVNSLAFSPDGRRLASAGDDGSVRIWPADTGELADAICARLDRNLTRQEWNRFIGAELTYERTCPDLPDGDSTPRAR